MSAKLHAIEGRVPRHDLDAEAAVLSACMLDGTARDIAIEMLEPEHFYSRPNATIFEAVRALAVDGKPVDNVQVAGWLRARDLIMTCGGPKYLAVLTDATPAVAHVAAHAETVRKLARLRAVQSLAHEVAARSYGDVGDPDEWIDECEAKLHALAHDARQEGALRPLQQVLTDTFREVSEAAERGGAITGTPTRFVDLDKKTAGLHGGDLTIVAARPGVGKSSAVRNIAVNVASPRSVPAPGEHAYDGEEVMVSGHGVAIFSLEMPRNQVAAAMACCEARVDLARLRAGQLTQDDWTHLTHACSTLASLPIWIDDTPGVTLLYVRAKLRRLHAQLERDRKADPSGPALGAVVIDYLQLMTGRKDAKSREQEIAEISRGLKELAKELNVPVIALSQLNRAVETRASKSKDKGKRPMLSDLRESGAIEQDADNVIFIYRPEMDDPDGEDRGIAELIIAKQRNGPTGTIRLRFIKHCTRFENLAPHEYPEFEEEWQ